MVRRVFVDVSSMKASRANALLKNRVRRLVHSSRALAISGLCCSLALRLFFIAEPQPVQEPADRCTMDIDPAPGQFEAQLVQCHLAMARHTFADPSLMGRELAAGRVALPGRRERAR